MSGRKLRAILLLLILGPIGGIFGYQLARYPSLTFQEQILALRQKIILIAIPSGIPMNVNFQHSNSKAAVSLLYKCTSEAGDKIIYLVRQWAGNLDGGGDHRNSYFSESGDLIESFYVPPYTKVAPAQMPLKDCVVIKRRIPSGLDYGPSDWFTSTQKK